MTNQLPRTMTAPPKSHRLAVVCVAIAGAIVSVAPAIAGDTESWTEETFARAKPQSKPSAEAKIKRATRSNLGGPKSEDSPKNTPTRRPSLSGGSISWQASSGCVPGALRGVLNAIASTFGPVTVTSTCRSAASNRAAGGAGKSYHLSGEAVDFRTHGSTGAVYAYLSSNGGVGGLKHYGGGLFHIDTGPRRSW
jgi:Peptidase M15